MKEKVLKRLLLIFGICFFLLFFLTPFLWMVAVSFSSSPNLAVRGGFRFTMENYSNILGNKNLHFPDYLKNSLIVSSLSSIISAIIGGMCAYVISRFRFRGRTILILSVLALSMFPQICIVGYLFKIMSSASWINTYRALFFPYVAFSLPLALWILLGYFSQIPGEIDEAALVDGATRWQTFFKVIVPITLPGFLSAFLLLFMFAFNEFLFALMLTVDHRARTVPVGIALFQGLHGEIPWGNIMASSVLSCLPLVLIAVAAQRYVIRGLTGGALK